MKVSACEKCNYYQRRTWVTSYVPANFHRIGVTHAYGYCKKYGKRCLEVQGKICPELCEHNWIDDGQYAEGHNEHSYHCSLCGDHKIE